MNQSHISVLDDYIWIRGEQTSDYTLWLPDQLHPRRQQICGWLQNSAKKLRHSWATETELSFPSSVSPQYLNEVLLKSYYTDLIHQAADGPGKEMKTHSCWCDRLNQESWAKNQITIADPSNTF